MRKHQKRETLMASESKVLMQAPPDSYSERSLCLQLLPSFIALAWLGGQTTLFW
ncbi:MAG TPA: exosortase, partial [Verrucomicrobiales bacterium]|nr:exosortase [Verrucomicrobiales bacterium]